MLETYPFKRILGVLCELDLTFSKTYGTLADRQNSLAVSARFHNLIIISFHYLFLFFLPEDLDDSVNNMRLTKQAAVL